VDAAAVISHYRHKEALDFRGHIADPLTGIPGKKRTGTLDRAYEYLPTFLMLFYKLVSLQKYDIAQFTEYTAQSDSACPNITSKVPLLPYLKASSKKITETCRYCSEPYLYKYNGL
jgi:hypothetical protein